MQQEPNTTFFAIDQNYIPSPKAFYDLEQFIIRECKGSDKGFVDFLENLNQRTQFIINFNSFRKFMRIIKKYVKITKNEQIQLLFSDFLIKEASKYFPYHIKSNKVEQFKQYLELIRGLKIKQPETFQNQRQLIIYLQCSEYSEEWALKLIEKINNDVIVDKKNLTANSLKINSFFSEVLGKFIEKIIPQLQRLLVRSQSNIEVWQDTLSNIISVTNMQKSLDVILKKVKNYFINYPDISIQIMNSIGKALNSFGSFKEFMTFLGSIITNEHNSKKKLSYLKMSEGLIEALEKFSKIKDHQKEANYLINQVLSIFSLSYSKFTEDDEFAVVLQLLDKLLPLVKNPTDEIAKNMKILLKNQNKNILLYLALTLNIYSSDDISNLPSVKEAFAHFKAQIPLIAKKIGAGWQWFVHIIGFMAKSDQTYFEYLSDDLPIFKNTCVSLLAIQKKNLLEILSRYYKYMIAEQTQISDHFWTTATLLLQEAKSREIWELFILSLSISDKFLLISNGIYPLIWYPSKQLKINKSGNQFKSLIRFIFSNISQKDQINGYQVHEVYKILIACKICDVKLDKKITFKAEEENKTKLEEIQNKFVKAALYDYENDEELKILPSHVDLIKIGAEQLFKIHQTQQFHSNFSECLKPYNFEKNLDYIIEFEQQARKSVIQLQNHLKGIRETLFERNFSHEEAVPEKKVYINPLLIDTRMMSEQQVKAQKYRKHFEKMIHYLKCYFEIILTGAKIENLLFKIWDKHFTSIIKITQYPQARTSVYRLVRVSIERTYLNLTHEQFIKNSKEDLIEIRIFQKYSLFFAEFFCIRNSNITPSLKLMEKSSGFLKSLLAISFLHSPIAEAIFKTKKQYILWFVNDMCQEILENMQFDLNIKKLAITFYYKSNQRCASFYSNQILYSLILKNINILSSSEHLKSVLITVMKRIDDLERFNELFEDILNYVSDTKVLILAVINELIIKHEIQYQPGFQEYIKLKILALEQSREQISALSNQIIKKQSSENKDILKFNLKKFVKRNSKQTIEKLCIFIKQEMRPQQVEPIFQMFVKTFKQLFDQGLDQEGLEIFPYFLSLNLQLIAPALFGDIFELLVLKFTANQNYVTLNKLSMDVGKEIIKYYSQKNIKYAEEILKVLQAFINRSTGVSNILFLGVLAKYLQGNKNLVIVEKQITQLFKGEKQGDQKAIAKFMPDLMTFFKEPVKIVEKIFLDINGLSQSNQLGQAYLATGLLKGIGHAVTMQYLERVISDDYVTKTKSEKSARVYLLTAFVEIFGRFVEIKGNRIVEIVILYMADQVEEIRNIAKRVGQTLILKMSAYAVKILLPILLTGLENQSNWRIKISYIWILGIMANCSARQLQTSLPIIVPTLSTCLSNAHPTIRNKASEALNLIGETIKNPEISNSIDILIEALQNPFEQSNKALDILLKTRFSHFIDAPSLSIIIPIIDYCLRGRISQLKASSCQVIGSIVDLIQSPYDLLPYLRIISGGLKAALCDPLPEIRSIAAMAIGRISAKIGIASAQEYFQFILDIIESPISNTTERQGAAQAYSEIICSHDYDYFEQSLNKIFEKLNEVKHSQKEGFILVFLYVPNIRKQQFEGFIRQVNQNMYSFVADEDENIRNSAMQVQKVLINNYCLSHTDLLLEPLCEGVFETNWRKRNGALILLGELINIIKSYMYNTRSQQKSYAYYKGLMAVYILKDDELQMPRLTANQVWNTYIENTPKTIKTGLKQLTKMWSKFTHEANGVVFKNIGQFSSKYGENYFQQILIYMEEFMADPILKKGVFQVLTEFVKRLQQQFLTKEVYRNKIRDFFASNIFTVEGGIRQALSKCLAIWVQKMREERFFEDLIYPQIQKLDSIGEESAEYTQCLHLMRDLLHTSSQKVVDRLINKIIQTPLSQFKIQVITNNADRLANQLYTQFKQPATQIFVEEIYQLINNKQKENRLALIIYCLEQVSLKLNHKYKIEFIRMMTLHLRKLIQKNDRSIEARDQTIIKKLLGVVFFFLSSIELADIEELEILIGELTPLVFIKDNEISESVHKIFQILISNPKQQKTPLYLKQMIVSLQNKALDRNISIIWDDQQITKNYINILVKCIAYGNSQTMEQSLQMMKFLMRYTKRQFIDKQILKIVGPVVRVINYPLLMKQKVLLMDFLASVFLKHFNIEVYSAQILSVCFRLLQEFKTKQEIMQCVSSQFQHLLIHSHNKNQLILSIINKIKIYGNILVEAVYHLIKNIVNEKVQLPKSTLQKIYTEFNHICIHNELKLPLRGVYYASKTAARLGTVLNVHMDALEAQLKAVTCPYQVVLNYLHFSYYKKLKVPKLSCIQVFIKQSSRQKVHFLLKSLRLCRKVSEQTKQIYTHKYITQIVPEGLSGFDDIIDLVEDFEE